MLGARAERGRLFTEEEGEIGNEKKAILTYGLWQELYGGDEGVVGRDLRVNGVPYTIVGVLPESFLFLTPEVRLFVPAAFTVEDKSDESRHSNNWEMIGRLAPTATVAEAQAELDGLNARNFERFPEMAPLLKNAGFHSTVLLWRDDLTQNLRGTLHLLWGGVAFVLLIACVNIANLLLVRSQVRLKEMAIRSSMGAGRARVARQLLTETLLLTLLGGAAGVALGYAALSLLRGFGIEELPRGSENPDGCRLRGAHTSRSARHRRHPLAHSRRAHVEHEPRGRRPSGGAQVDREVAGPGSSGKVSSSFRSDSPSFSSSAPASSSRAFAGSRKSTPGFVRQASSPGRSASPVSRYARGRVQGTEDFPERVSFAKRALDAVRALPGVQKAGLISDIPFGGSYSDSVVIAEGYQMQPGESVISPSRVSVSPGYFEAMGIPLLKGRLFDERDDEKAPNVVIVDDRLARKFWPESDPLGKRMYTPNSKEDLLRPGADVTWYTVVGVVGSVRERGLVESDDRLGMYYFPYAQEPTRFFTFVVRTPSRPDSVAAGVRAAIAAIDPELPLFDVHSMEERVNESLLTRRTSLLLSASFGLIALFLAALGSLRRPCLSREPADPGDWNPDGARKHLPFHVRARSPRGSDDRGSGSHAGTRRRARARPGAAETALRRRGRGSSRSPGRRRDPRGRRPDRFRDSRAAGVAHRPGDGPSGRVGTPRVELVGGTL